MILLDAKNRETEIYEVFVLFEEKTGTTEDIILSDVVTNYEYIEVFFEADNVQQSIRVSNANNKNISLMIHYINENYMHFLFEATYFVLDKDVKHKFTKTTFISDKNEVGSYGTSKYIKITKIVGYK